MVDGCGGKEGIGFVFWLGWYSFWLWLVQILVWLEACEGRGKLEIGKECKR